MKPKGSQFEQLQLFDSGPATPTGGGVGSGEVPSKHMFDQKFDKEMPDQYQYDQKDLPHGMAEREYTDDWGWVRRPDSHEWAPTWNVETEQPSVGANKFRSRMEDMDYDQGTAPEGQEARNEINDRPLTTMYRGKAADGGDLHVLMDGNHRISAERHRGAMFHRVKARDMGDEKPPDPRVYLSDGQES